jgi:predicted dehydrogenase
MVNYIRRFAFGYQKIKKQIDSGAFGTALNCRVLYTRGLRHEGCHALDLMRYFFGTWYESYAKLRDVGVDERRYIVDRDENDPTVYASFDFEKCANVVFQPCDGRKYGIFEIDICFENCRIRFIDNGLYYETYPITKENEWGHKSLNYQLTDVIRKETGLNIALYNLIDNAVKFLDGKEKLICTAADAVAVHKILQDIRE